MADNPALFSAPMVRALLREIAEPGTGKTQTRRELNPKPNMLNGGKPLNNGLGAYSTDAGWKRFRYAVGDRLWVREAWRVSQKWDAYKPRELPAKNMSVYFDAGGFICNVDTPDDWRPTVEGEAPEWAGKLRPSMFMPRWASRITLEVTGVKVERLQDISEADAIAEGIERDTDGWKDYLMPSTQCCGSAIDSYRTLWDHINGPGAWDKNPWVAAYTFRPILGNIDQLTEAA